MTNIIKTLAFGAALTVAACGASPALAVEPLVTTDPQCYDNSFKVIGKLSDAGYKVEHTFEDKTASTVLATTADGRYVILWIKGDAICIMMEGTLLHVAR